MPTHRSNRGGDRVTTSQTREPSGPSPQGERLRRPWLIGWLLVTIGLGVALTIAWFGGAGVEVLGSLGAATALAASVALHHLVVTQDAGERAVPRENTDTPDPIERVGRRHLLTGGAAAVVLGLAALVGLRRAAPPAPTGRWASGAALVTIGGDRVRPEDVPLGGVVTVWPEGAAGTERSAVMLLRLRDAAEEPTRLDGVIDGTLVAYSRLCTHAGCAVALYRDVDQALFCPCHQATFDAQRGAQPTAGPASVPLPQLPLALADDGTLVAAGDLTARPGPVGGRA